MLRAGESLEETCTRLKVAACQVGVEIRIATEEVDTLEKELCSDY